MFKQILARVSQVLFFVLALSFLANKFEILSFFWLLQVNRAFKVKFDKKHFIGKSSLLAQKNKGVTKKLVQFQLIDFNKDMDMWPGGGIALTWI